MSVQKVLIAVAHTSTTPPTAAYHLSSYYNLSSISLSTLKDLLRQEVQYNV